MKYQGKRPVGEDKDFSAYVFSLRREEVELLKSMLEQSLIYTPKTLETTKTRGRMLNMKRMFIQVLEDEEKEKHAMQEV